MMCKTRTKIISVFEQKGSRIKDIISLNEVMLIRRCLKCCSERKVTMYSEPSGVKSLPDSNLLRKQTMIRFSWFSSAMKTNGLDSIAI
jgi:hypothetical protein